jgi:hypothetical protein
MLLWFKVAFGWVYLAFVLLLSKQKLLLVFKIKSTINNNKF